MEFLKAKRLPDNGRVKRTFIKVDNEYYKSGDTISVRLEDNQSAYATIEKIWWNFDLCCGELLIRWFYRAIDLEIANYISFSEIELFDSDEKQIIEMEMIEEKILVLKYNDFVRTEDVEDVFFTRATFSPQLNKIVPSIDEWKRVCKCNKIFNPDEPYFTCPGCYSIYHNSCLGYSQDIDEVEIMCSKCRLIF
ncbi:unnamed protein product [Blepharisma stoltei]|uniref:BAH domain-containing protein n=1 Tax=Blepharisma stoltei TaxID=1481888 RepID=A0AAU9KPZ1_9CILI|nr:unnamed protein product [Blepharisma stoltei]